jgi:hypothetical protein
MRSGKMFPYRSTLVVLAATAAVSAPAAVAAPVSVNLRVEGATHTIYDEQITTDGHAVTTQKGGTHVCDGTNGGANPSPGPTGTAALDDGARLGRFGWDGPFFDGFGDFAVERVGADVATSTQFWGLLLNYDFTSVGGCQQRIAEGDQVLWAYDAFSKVRALKLAGPTVATTGVPVPLRVTDGKSGAPQAGAVVGGATARADGMAMPVFNTPGVYSLKAEKEKSVRSNGLKLCVDPPGIEACTTGDRTSPTARLLPLPSLLSDHSRTRSFTVAWDGDDGPTGSGVTRYDLEARLAGGTFRGLLANTKLTSFRFRGAPGARYEFRVRAIDRAGNRSAPVVGSTLIPFDDRDKAVHFSRGWKRLERKGAWGRFVRRSTRAGATVELHFRGTRVTLVGRRMRRGGRLRFTVDGKSRILGLRGKARFRSALYHTGSLPAGAHTLRLKALDDSRPVELDALAVSA